MNLGHVQQYDPCVQNDKSLVVVPSAVGVEEVGVPSLFARHNSGSSTHDEWKDSLSFMARFGLDLYTPGGRCPMVSREKVPLREYIFRKPTMGILCFDIECRE